MATTHTATTEHIMSQRIQVIGGKSFQESEILAVGYDVNGELDTTRTMKEGEGQTALWCVGSDLVVGFANEQGYQKWILVDDGNEDTRARWFAVTSTKEKKMRTSNGITEQELLNHLDTIAEKFNTFVHFTPAHQRNGDTWRIVLAESVDVQVMWDDEDGDFTGWIYSTVHTHDGCGDHVSEWESLDSLGELDRAISRAIA